MHTQLSSSISEINQRVPRAQNESRRKTQLGAEQAAAAATDPPHHITDAIAKAKLLKTHFSWDRQG
jgi:hypothetical protein